MTAIKPYENEEESVAIGDLTIENRMDRVSIYGTIELTRDKPGLQRARALKAVLDGVVSRLERDKNLADRIVDKPTDQIGNPFS